MRLLLVTQKRTQEICNYSHNQINTNATRYSFKEKSFSIKRIRDYQPITNTLFNNGDRLRLTSLSS